MAIVVRRSVRLEETVVNVYCLIDQGCGQTKSRRPGMGRRLSAKVGRICALAPGAEVPLA